jgi:hypothetical protein
MRLQFFLPLPYIPLPCTQITPSALIQNACAGHPPAALAADARWRR